MISKKEIVLISIAGLMITVLLRFAPYVIPSRNNQTQNGIELKDLLNEYEPVMVLNVRNMPGTWGATTQIGISHEASLNEETILIYLPDLYVKNNIVYHNVDTGFFLLKDNRIVEKLTPTQIQAYIKILQE